MKKVEMAARIKELEDRNTALEKQHEEGAALILQLSKQYKDAEKDNVGHYEMLANQELGNKIAKKNKVTLMGFGQSGLKEALEEHNCYRLYKYRMESSMERGDSEKKAKQDALKAVHEKLVGKGFQYQLKSLYKYFPAS